MIHITEKWKAFREWQQQPYQVAAKSPEPHRCRTCGEEFVGNYCPRCGQSSRIGRYSLKNALLLFLDVWGLGNRGMFRTLRDLILRPGYMIRDYISGMQMAYFPPFKLLFLLTALHIVVRSGFNLNDQNFWGTTTEQTIEKTAAPTVKEEARVEVGAVNGEPEVNDFQGAGSWMDRKIKEYGDKYRNYLVLMTVFSRSIFIYFFIRRSPNIPDMRFSELLITMVYIWNMVTIYKIAVAFLGIKDGLLVQSLLPIIPLKQLTGFTWWRIILAVAVTYLLFVMLLLAAILAVGFLGFEVSLL